MIPNRPYKTVSYKVVLLTYVATNFTNMVVEKHCEPNLLLRSVTLKNFEFKYYSWTPVYVKNCFAWVEQNEYLWFDKRYSNQGEKAIFDKKVRDNFILVRVLVFPGKDFDLENKLVSCIPQYRLSYPFLNVRPIFSRRTSKSL